MLVLSHEAGHFFSAKYFGIKVEEFGFGLPPRMLGFKKGETVYSINWLPFGGFVKIFGEDSSPAADTNKAALDIRNFGHKPPWVRSIVLLSGVIANILLAFILLTIISFGGIPEQISNTDAAPLDAAITITEIAGGSPASESDLKIGDEIKGLKFDTESLKPSSIENVQSFIKTHQGQDIILVISRGGIELEKTVHARENPPLGEGSLGIALSLIGMKDIPWYRAPIEGAKMTWTILKGTILGFWTLLISLIFGTSVPIEVAGPVGIFNLTAEAQSLGISSFLIFMAILSINLAIINILPVPGLDGGRFLFVLIEKIRGRRISEKLSSIVHGAGLAFLIIMMLLITFYDISKVF